MIYFLKKCNDRPRKKKTTGYLSQGNLLTLVRSAPTASNPTGRTVDQLTYTYTARTNRLASVADVADPVRGAVTTDLDWDAKPTDFIYNRVGSVVESSEMLTQTSSRTTLVERYDCLPRPGGERQLPEQLRLTTYVLPGGAMDNRRVSYRYDVEDPVCGANGQRISKAVAPVPVIGPPPEPYLQERYVRDGMRLVGVFDENNNLKSWNLGGAVGLVGRADPDPHAFLPVHRYYVTDHLGSIRAVVNASGTVIEGRDYYPYGLTMPGRFYVEADTTREGFTGHELDKETGDYYAGARFYAPALARWFVVDPIADAYPEWSSFNYVMGNPVMLVDPDGMAPDPPHGPGRYAARTSTRTLGFVIRNPRTAQRIGRVRTGSNNISTSTVRFSTRGNVLQENRTRGQIAEGSEVNAFRHALWQASIASEFGNSIAAQIGNAHEANPFADLSQRQFANMSSADEVVDLLNNAIGREIGADSGANMQELVLGLLDVFASEGLWVVTESGEGNFIIERTIITQDQYRQLRGIFMRLDISGWYDHER